MVHIHYVNCHMDANPHYHPNFMAVFLIRIFQLRMQTVQLSISAFFLPPGQ